MNKHYTMEQDLFLEADEYDDSEIVADMEWEEKQLQEEINKLMTKEDYYYARKNKKRDKKISGSTGKGR